MVTPALHQSGPDNYQSPMAWLSVVAAKCHNLTAQVACRQSRHRRAWWSSLPISAAQLEIAAHQCSKTLGNIDLPFCSKLVFTQVNVAAASTVALGENGGINTETKQQVWVC